MAPTATSSPSPTDPPTRVLIADDHADSADCLAMLVRWLGHDVKVAYDGEEAARLVDDFRPDMALFDINMPCRDGYEVARYVRERLGASVVLVAMTGAPTRETAPRAEDAGFDEHLTKPVQLEDLERILRH